MSLSDAKVLGENRKKILKSCYKFDEEQTKQVGRLMSISVFFSPCAGSVFCVIRLLDESFQVVQQVVYYTRRRHRTQYVHNRLHYYLNFPPFLVALAEQRAE
jgi:hypothetical protein